MSSSLKSIQAMEDDSQLASEDEDLSLLPETISGIDRGNDNHTKRNKQTKPTKAKRTREAADVLSATKRLKHAGACSGNTTPISLKDLPECTLPADLHAQGYRAFMATLTEAGKNQALKLCLGEAKATICLICVDKGIQTANDCLLKDEVGKGGNLAKHFGRHIRDKDVTGNGARTMLRITELKGTTVGPLSHTAADGNLSVAQQTTGNHEVTRALTGLMHAQALPFEFVSCNELGQLLRAAKSVQYLSNLDISPMAVKRESLDMLKKYRSELAGAFNEFPPIGRVHLMHGDWESNGKKYFGISVSFVTTRPDGSLKYWLKPLAFKHLEMDYKTGMIQSDKVLLKTLETAITEVGLSKQLIASVHSLNAANDVSSAFVDTESTTSPLGYRRFLGYSATHAFDDYNPVRQQSCLNTMLALLVTHAVDLKESAANNDLVDGENPSPPTAVTDALEAARRQARFLRIPKMRSGLLSMAAKKHLKAYLPSSENVTSWWSTQEMLKCTILNYVAMECFECCLSSEELVIIQQVHAILEPLVDVTMKLSQMSSRPISPATLPLVYFMLDFYGVDVSKGIFVSELKLIDHYESKVMFSVLQPDGSPKNVFLRSFEDVTKEFFVRLVKNLVSRLHKMRGNKFFYEIVGMLVDPVMKTFAKSILPRDEALLYMNWTFHDARRWAMQALQTIRDSTPSASEKVDSRCFIDDDTDGHVATNMRESNEFPVDEGLSIVDGTPTVVDEFVAFSKEVPQSIRSHMHEGRVRMNLTSFSKLLSAYDPLAYWGPQADGPGPAQRFPTIFRLNLTTLGYVSSSAFQESVFTAGKRVLTGDRTKRDDDDLAEASVILHAAHTLHRSEFSETWDMVDDAEEVSS